MITEVSSSPDSIPDRLAAPGWWRGPFRMVQTNLRLVDADLDVAAVADFIVDHGADAWLLNTGGIYSSYPSALNSQTPNPHLALRASGDIVGDAVAAAHARGLKLLARMDFSKVLPHIADAHPDWLYVSATGQHQVFNDLVTTCPSAGYFQHELFTILDEVLDRFDVDGFFINWFMYSEMNYAHQYLGPCHCDTCKALWRSDNGGELPTGRDGPLYSSWTAWSRRNVLDLGARIRAHIAAHKSDAPLILHDTADIRYIEANNAVGREFWPHQTAESVSAAFSRAPDTPVLVNSVAFLDFPYRMAAEHPERFAQYLIQAMSRGASISTYIMGPPGAIDYPLLGLAREITRFHRRSDALYANLVPNARVAVVAPPQLCDRGPVPAPVAEFRGWYQALQELHIPFDVVEAGHLEAILGPLGAERYSTIVIPGVSALDAAAAGALDDWVHAGGSAITSLSQHRDSSDLPRCLGIEAVVAAQDGDQLLSAYAQDVTGAVIPLHGRAHTVQAAAGSQVLAWLVPPARFGPPEYCYGHNASADPALLEHRWGHGRAVTHTWSAGRAYRDLALADLRAAIAASLGDQFGELAVDTTLPDSVELIAGRSGGRGVYHLNNLSGVRRNGFTEPTAVAGGHTVRIPGAAACRAYALIADQALDIRPDRGDAIVALPEIGRFEVLVWEDTEAL